MSTSKVDIGCLELLPRVQEVPAVNFGPPAHLCQLRFLVVFLFFLKMTSSYLNDSFLPQVRYSSPYNRP